MATVRLESYGGQVRDLPDVCMKCGMPSSVRKKRTFSWHPPWVAVLLLAGLLPFAIVALILTKRCRIAAPLCDRHKNHWLWRQLIVIGSFLALLALGFVAFTLLTDERRGASGAFGGLLCLGVMIGLIIWLVAAVNLHFTSIRPKEITNTSITLAGVSETFIQKYEMKWRPAMEQLDEVVRERWNQADRRLKVHPLRDVEIIEEDETRHPPPDAFRE